MTTIARAQPYISMFKAKLTALIIALVAIGLAVATLWFPMPVNWQDGWDALHTTLITSALHATLLTGAAILMLIGLRGFKTKLKIAYALIAIGVVIEAISFAQIPIVNIFDLWNTPWVKLGYAVIPLIIGIFPQYFGMRLWAKQLKVLSIATKWWFVLLFVVGGIGIFVLLPHQPSTISEFELDAKNALLAWSASLNVLCIWLIVRIRQTTTAVYRIALTWLMVGLALNLLTTLFAVSLELLGVPSYKFWLPFNFLDEILVLNGLGYLRAAYLFNRIGSYDDEGAGRLLGKREKAGAPLSPFDVVLYLADLASNPFEIDPILDRFRQITAIHTAGQPLSASDKNTLISVYKQLEQYLITKEAVRNFNQPGLRELVANKFPTELTTEFFAEKHSK